VPKGRPRKGKGHFYTPRRTKEWEQSLAWAWAQEHGNKVLYPQGSLGVLNAYFFHDKRSADLDNLLKSTWDACNGLAWKDDGQIVITHGCKNIAKTAGVGLWVVPGDDPCSICKQMCRLILEECPWEGVERKRK